MHPPTKDKLADAHAPFDMASPRRQGAELDGKLWVDECERRQACKQRSARCGLTRRRKECGLRHMAVHRS